MLIDQAVHGSLTIGSELSDVQFLERMNSDLDWILSNDSEMPVDERDDVFPKFRNLEISVMMLLLVVVVSTVALVVNAHALLRYKNAYAVDVKEAVYQRGAHWTLWSPRDCSEH